VGFFWSYDGIIGCIGSGVLNEVDILFTPEQNAYLGPTAPIKDYQQLRVQPKRHFRAKAEPIMNNVNQVSPLISHSNENKVKLRCSEMNPFMKI
jgi:hypothetical protein